jgi:hypothetical protein
MVTRRYQRDYQNLNLHTDNTMVTRRYQTDYQNLNLHTRQYNGHKKIPKRLSEPKSTQDNTMVTRRHQRDYQNLNLHNTIQWSQGDTKEIIRT